MIRGIRTHDAPGTSDMAVAGALADAGPVFCDRLPTGPYLNTTAKLPPVQPRQVRRPVLICGFPAAGPGGH